jgi:hypothetical protein
MFDLCYLEVLWLVPHSPPVHHLLSTKSLIEFWHHLRPEYGKEVAVDILNKKAEIAWTSL